MKALMIFGSIIGFLIAAACGWAGGSPWQNILWRACAAALGSAILTRWWSEVWFDGLRDAIEQRRHLKQNPQEKNPTAKV